MFEYLYYVYMWCVYSAGCFYVGRCCLFMTHMLAMHMCEVIHQRCHALNPATHTCTPRVHVTHTLPKLATVSQPHHPCDATRTARRSTHITPPMLLRGARLLSAPRPLFFRARGSRHIQIEPPQRTTLLSWPRTCMCMLAHRFKPNRTRTRTPARNAQVVPIIRTYECCV